MHICMQKMHVVCVCVCLCVCVWSGLVVVFDFVFAEHVLGQEPVGLDTLLLAVRVVGLVDLLAHEHMNAACQFGGV